MSRVHLGDVAIEHKETCKEDKSMYPIVGLEHLTPEQITLQNWDLNTENTFTKVFRKGNILFGRRRAYLKKAAVAPFDGICSGDITVIEAKEDKIIPELLPFVIQNDDLFDFAVGKSAGSLSPRVKWTHLQNYEFELPDKQKQHELAKVLWAIEDTRKSYQQLIKRTDELVKSQFIELFGAPFTEDCIPNGKFRDITLEMIKGPFGSDMKKSLLVEKGNDTYKVYLQINAIQKNENIGDNYISKEYYDCKMSRFAAYPGDYLITCDGTLGKFIRLDEKMEPGVISPSLLKIKLNENKIVPRFFEAYWELFIVDYLVNRTRNTALVHLPSAKVIGEIDIFIPEMNKQQQYVKFAQQSDKSKFELNRALDELTATYKQIIKDNLG